MLRKVPFCFGKKYQPFPALGVGKNLLLFQEEEKTFLFQGKKRRTFLFHVEKEPKDRKGKGNPLPFSIPSPLTAKWKQTFRYALSLQYLQDRLKTKGYRLSKTEAKKVCRDFHVKQHFAGPAKVLGSCSPGADEKSSVQFICKSLGKR